MGEGSIFKVYFPVAEEKAKRHVVRNEPLSLGHGRILLIDDETMIVNLTKTMLEALGYKVSGFLDCAEALQTFKENPQDFDMVLTDYGMPKMNGKQLAEQLKMIRSDIPIVLFSGYGDLVAREDIGTWGMDDLLMKPFELKDLSQVVERVLKKPW